MAEFLPAFLPQLHLKKRNRLPLSIW